MTADPPHPLACAFLISPTLEIFAKVRSLNSAKVHSFRLVRSLGLHKNAVKFPSNTEMGFALLVGQQGI
jgi:hypothetical protein